MEGIGRDLGTSVREENLDRKKNQGYLRMNHKRI